MVFMASQKVQVNIGTLVEKLKEMQKKNIAAAKPAVIYRKNSYLSRQVFTAATLPCHKA